MQIAVKGKQLDVGASLRSHVESTLADLVAKYFDQPIEATVTFSREAHLLHADLHVHAARGIMLQADGAAVEAYPAYDAALAKMAVQLKRYKKKLRDHHAEARLTGREQLEAAAAKSYILNPADDATGEAHDHPMVVAETTLPIETLSVAAAVMKLDLSGASALLFQNSGTSQLNMVYRRKDGHIGWVEPPASLAAAPARRSA